MESELTRMWKTAPVSVSELTTLNVCCLEQRMARPSLLAPPPISAFQLQVPVHCSEKSLSCLQDVQTSLSRSCNSDMGSSPYGLLCSPLF